MIIAQQKAYDPLFFRYFMFFEPLGIMLITTLQKKLLALQKDP